MGVFEKIVIASNQISIRPSAFSINRNVVTYQFIRILFKAFLDLRGFIGTVSLISADPFFPQNYAVSIEDVYKTWKNIMELAKNVGFDEVNAVTVEDGEELLNSRKEELSIEDLV
jgi:hypothetical protein